MPERRSIVVKVGGSLLDWPQLPTRLGEFLDSALADRRVVLITGGGAFADVVRGLDQVHGLGERISHALAIRAMDLTARLLEGLTTGTCVVEDLADLDRAWARGLRPILAPSRYLETVDETGDDPLPISWETTSDSIAARIADRIGSTRLILLKSARVEAATRREAAERGLVDPSFPGASGELEHVECVAFREPRWKFHRLA